MAKITESERAEEALRESEERFRSAFEHTAVGMALVSLEGRFIRVNRSLSDILGYSPEELASTRWQVTTHPDDIEITQSHMRRLLAGETDSRHFERRCLHKRGHDVWGLLSLSLVRQADGTPLYFISQLQDISERKRAEEALRDSEERFRSAFEHAAIGMALAGTDGRLLQVNRSLCQMLGYSGQELTSTTWQAITHPDDLDIGRDHMRRMLAREMDSCQFDKRYLHNLGHEVSVLLSFSLVRDADGDPLYFIAQIQDITARKRAEEQLRESEERYRDLHENAPAAYFVVGLDGRISRANRRAAELFGYDIDALVGRSVFDLYADTPAGRDKAQMIFERFRAGEDVRDEEVEFRRADGTSVWVSKTVRVIRDARGEIIESRSWAVDITERKRAEEALQKAREELEGKVERQLLRRNPYGLTFRELTVLHKIAAGRSDKEVGLELDISHLTAQKHTSNILAKMQAASRTEAAARALREGLLE